ncbi:helicase-primase primase subunit [Gallid alphaherpesvirus 1]|uniref:Helicase-primase complex n=1 Tax=Infectious laryngotracheitis virus TaxID=10386 RepID=Q9QCE1_ILTV|nr:helicase-primase primase subunit [Gallid alphaherpesvirus 1]AFD36549.1 UL52 protein [Gallid alphaherpesvirus 1]AFD36628.1 UL52 protein [Gallid alphaherpesvirus 1]AFM36213.1 UL52 protein [Gallid alphaherpesvirus 1]AFM36370.1 UL52 protein [Gallid alphaherpesvirus 1]AFM36448.1 UL52 protein [Gallid alphaherpesvirus 1]
MNFDCVPDAKWEYEADDWMLVEMLNETETSQAGYCEPCGAPPSEDVSYEEIRVLYATDGYPVVCSLHLLLGQALQPEIYVLAFSHVDALAQDFCKDSPLKITFFLPANTGAEKYRQRSRPVFVCRFVGQGAATMREALAEGFPIDAKLLLETMDLEETFALHTDIIEALGVIFRAENTTNKIPFSAIHATLPRGRPALEGLMLQHESRVIAAYRRLYNSNFSNPFWFVSKFGPSEITLVAAMRYYLLEATPDDGIAGTFDLQAVKDLCITFQTENSNNRSNLTIARLTSFSAFSKFWCSSYYATRESAKLFRDHLRLRTSADRGYSEQLEALICKYRHALRLPARDFISFVYLAYSEGYGRNVIREHLQCLSENLTNPVKSSARAQSDFFKSLRECCNFASYFRQHVTMQVMKLPAVVAGKFAAIKSYGEIQGRNFLGFCRSAFDVSTRIDRLYSDTLCRYGAHLADMLVRNVSTVSSNEQEEEEEEEEEEGDDASAPHALAQKRERDGQYCKTGDIIFAPLSRLLSLVSSDQVICGKRPVTLLFHSLKPTSIPPPTARNGPCPVYRVTLAGHGQAFAAIASDEWDSIITADVRSDTSIHDSCLLMRSDAPLADQAMLPVIDFAWTSAMNETAWGTSSKNKIRASCSGLSQMYLNRNEVLNESLAIQSLILDIDIPLKLDHGPITMLTLHKAMRAVRVALIQLIALLFPETSISHDTYPVYFYKSHCSSPESHDAQYSSVDIDFLENTCSDDIEDEENMYLCDSGWVEEMSWCDEHASEHGAIVSVQDLQDALNVFRDRANSTLCKCKEKLGFRVCVPIPSPYALFGLETVKTIAKLAQHVILLQEEIIECLDDVIRDYDFIDTGIYSPGRSLRLPFFAKVSESGFMSGRLLPFIIFPPDCADKVAFAAAHKDPNNFHFHAFRPDNPTPNIIVTRIACPPDVIGGVSKPSSNLPQTAVSLSLAEAFSRVNLAPCEDRTGAGVDTIDGVFVLTTYVLPAITNYIKEHFPSLAHEYSDISFGDVRVLKTRITASLLRNRRGCGGRATFTCLKHSHRSAAAQTVITSVAVAINSQGNPYAAFQTKCFATKCGGNTLQTQFTVRLTKECCDQNV